MGTTVPAPAATASSTAAAAKKFEGGAPRASPGRLISLDIFRGMTIAGMILVNNAGNWNAVYWPLDHAAWNGWTPTDLIFPFFLFIVGVSMVLSFEVRRQRGATRETLLRHAIQRSVIILLIGWALAGWAQWFDVHTMRFYGVLPRIALVYLAASAIVLYCGRRTRAALAAGLLIGYWLLMTRWPGFDLTMDGNLAGYVDRQLLYEHLWIAHRFDPEGLLSTLPAIVTTLMGVWTGERMRASAELPRPRQTQAEPGHPLETSGHEVREDAHICRNRADVGNRRDDIRAVHGMVIAGAVCMAAGELWGRWFPINKNMWTSSYVLFTGGFALAALALCYWAVEVRGWRRWGAPFVWYGMNAITVYAASSALGVFSVTYHVRPGVTYKAWVYGHGFAPLARPANASLMYASGYVLIFLVLAWGMYRKKIFVKI